ncbi:MAG TPA: hypothetical protein VKV26_13545 [Dehalococcoidia bacterium]|nr:hypothetical protein [Dehalococcoidia bacterium]
MAIGPAWTAPHRPVSELQELRNLRPVIHGRRVIVFYDGDAPARNAACCLRIDGHYLWLNDLRTTVPLRQRIRSMRGGRHRLRFLQTGSNVELVLDEGGRGWLRMRSEQPGRSP